MCAIAYNADGSLTSAPKGEFEAGPKYQVVYVDGRPSYFEGKTKSAILTEASANALNKVNGAAPTPEDDKKSAAPAPCPHCGKTTHVESRCFDKYPHLAPQWVKKRMASKMTTPDNVSDDDSTMPIA